MSEAGSSRHSIRRATVEFEGSAGGDAFAFQQEAGAWVKGRLLPGLEEIFSSLPETEELVCIDRLEISLDTAGKGAWSEPDLRKLRDDLQALVAGRIASTEHIQQGARLSSAEAFFRRLEYFLRHGVFPWSAAPAAAAEFQSNLSAWLDTAAPSAFRQPLLQVLSSRRSRLRMLRSFAPASLRRLAEKFFSLPAETWDAWDREVDRIHSAAGAEIPPIPPDFTVETLRARWHRVLMEALATRGFVYQDGMAAGMAREFMQRLSEESIGSVALSRPAFRTPAFDSARKSLSQALPAVAYPALAPERDAALTEKAGDADGISLRPQAAPTEAPPEQEGLYVADAGLILLAPFLITFFARLGLIEKGMLRNPGEAMALLHHLATGREDAQEFQLALAKVLCGCAIEDPVDLPAALPEKMKVEAGELLASAIEHWSVLKNTSVDGLREGFLQRPGKLSFTKRDEWLLQVEQKAYDMVLQHVPWNYAMVKLPWMKHLLRTEWVE